MTRDNLLFAIIGLLFGFIVGFIFASSMSQRQAAPLAAGQNQALPANHPAVGSDGGGGSNPAGMQAEVAAALDTARKEPNNFEAQLTAAELYYKIQRYDDAIGYLLKANQLKPDDFETIANLGMVNLQAGHYETSVKWYKAAQTMKPNDGRVQAALCEALLGQGDARAAEAALNRLVTLDPKNPNLDQFRERLANLKSGAKK